MENNEEIAIIGIGCRYPGGVVDKATFWRLLVDRIDPISVIPSERWNNAIFFDENNQKSGKTYVNQGGFLAEVDQFDAGFFKILPREASHVDPQQRLLLETTFHALRDARIGLKEIKGSSTAVFAGVYIHDYQHMELSRIKDIDAYSGTGTAMSILANRVSYFFDLHGPSMSIDTACSSSLVALDQACLALRGGNAELALAAGVNLILKPEMTIAMSKANMLSPDGRSKSFDADANGFVRSEGVGVLVLARLSDALRDNRSIIGVIKATGVNSDGNTKGISVPNGNAQKRLFSEVLKASGLSPKDIDYVEAHGTGTPVGDPIELNAIGEVFAKKSERNNTLYVGSVKSNIGHTESASGIAGVIKACLCLNKGEIAPNLHFNTPNPNINFSQYNLSVPTEAIKWPKSTRRLALINSFGFGGTNASAIIEDFSNPIVEQVQANQNQTHILPISAHNPDALKQNVGLIRKNLISWSSGKVTCAELEQNYIPFANDFTYRKSFVFENLDELENQLDDYLKSSTSEVKEGKEKSDYCFIFSGMGSQWPGMFNDMLDAPGFSENFSNICRRFKDDYSLNLKREVAKGRAFKVDKTELAQPSIFALQMALFTSLKKMGVSPAVIAGHSVGEIAAACAAGILKIEDAIKITYYRSQLQKTTEGKGKLLAVGASYNQLSQMIEDLSAIDIAAVNSPSSLTLAGSEAELSKLEKVLTKKDVFAKFVRVEVPYHSKYMASLKGEFFKLVGKVEPQKPMVKFISTITGNEEDYRVYDENYWWRNVRDTVLFKDAINKVLDGGYRNFVELGGHPVLSTSIKECLIENGMDGNCVPTLRREKSNIPSLYESLSLLFEIGSNIKFDVCCSHQAKKIDIPLYAFTKQRYWVNETFASGLVDYTAEDNVDSLLGSRVLNGLDVWRYTVDLKDETYLEDHKIKGSIVFPGAGYLNMMFHAVKKITKKRCIALNSVKFNKLLTLRQNNPIDLQIKVDSSRSIIIENFDEKHTLEENASAVYLENEVVKPEINFDELVPDHFDKIYSKEFVYLLFENMGLFYGERFQGIEKICVTSNESLAELKIPSDLMDGHDFLFHPAILDSALHCIFAALRVDQEESHRIGEVYLPVSIDEVCLYAFPNSTKLYSYTRIKRKSLNSFLGDIYIFDENKSLISLIRNVCCRSLGRKRSLDITDHQKGMIYNYEWENIEITENVKNVGNILFFARNNRLSDMVYKSISKINNLTLIRPKYEARNHTADYFVDSDDTNLNKLIGKIIEDNQIQLIINCWPISEKLNESQLEVCLKSEQHLGYGSTLNCAKALHDISQAEDVFFYVLTNGVHKVDDKDRINVTHSTIPGLIRVIRNELPKPKICHIDLPMLITDVDLNILTMLIGQDICEDELALRNGTIYAHRFRQVAREKLAQNDINYGNYSLYQNTNSDLKSISIVRTSRSSMLPNEVEIEVHSSGVNFKDLMKLTGLLPESVMENNYWLSFLGMECSGVVANVGTEVKNVKIGDKVLAFSKNSFQKYVVTNENVVFKTPGVLSYEQAASIPLTYFTAYYSLKYIANLKNGESVLIHSAAGGVGLSAIQIAKYLGATIYATAGSDMKRKYLRELGIDHVYDSRSLSFYDAILTDTSGKGVDVVLNSKPGEYLRKSFQLLAENGRFIELGKMDIVNNDNLSMQTFDKNISFYSVDVDKLLRFKSHMVREIFFEVMSLLEDNTIQPVPVVEFDIRKAYEAFDYMRRAEHIGKIILNFPVINKIATAKTILINPNASYIITGGLGGFGLEVGLWLASHGANHIIFQGRSAVTKDYQRDKLAQLKKMGVEIVVVKGDIGNEADVVSLIDKARSVAPLKGIFHAAAILDDALISDQNMTRFFNVMHSKILGAWYLHKHTDITDIDYFVNFSSIVAAIGNRGSANYAAANTFVDALSQLRSDQGKNTISVNWGLIANVGMATTEEVIRTKLEESGLIGMHTATGLKILDQCINHNNFTPIAIAEINWKRWSKYNGSSNSLRYKHLLDQSFNASEVKEETLFKRLSNLTKEDQEKHLISQVTSIIAPTVKLAANEIVRDKSLVDIGIDSLMALEISVNLQSIGIQIKITDLLKGITIEELVKAQIRIIFETANLEAKSNTQISAIPNKPKTFLKIYHNNHSKARYRMFCFPYAGASSTVFYEWSKACQHSSDIEIVSIALPGRGERIEEKPLTSVRHMAKLIVDEMALKLDKPYILLGHCLGAIIMYEVAKEIQNRKLSPAKLLIACAAVSPDYYYSPMVHTQPDTKFLDILKLLDFTNTKVLFEDEEFRNMFFPTLRADFEAVFTYNQTQACPTKINSPIIAIAAMKDLFAAPSAMPLWKNYTNKEFTFLTLDTHHYFIETHQDYLIKLVKNWIKNPGELSEKLETIDANPSNVTYENMNIPIDVTINENGCDRILLLTDEFEVDFAAYNEIDLSVFKEVVTIKLAVFRGNPHRYIREFIKVLNQELNQFNIMNTAVWGHGFGSTLAYELCCYIDLAAMKVKHLYVSGAAAPHRYVMPKVHLVDPSKLGFLFKVIDHPEYKDYNPAILEADRSKFLVKNFELHSGYHNYSSSSPITIPITALRFNNDIWTAFHGMDEWAKVTHAEFNIEELEGNHFFIEQSNRQFVKRILSSWCQGDHVYNKIATSEVEQ